jgi:hypothetical protein
VVKLFAASAFLDGRTKVHDGDLFILRHTWNNLDQREILDDVVEPIIAQYYAEHPDDPIAVPPSDFVAKTEMALDLARSLRHHSAVALPSEAMLSPDGRSIGQAWDLEYLTAGSADGSAFADKIAELDRAISRGMLVPSLLLEGGEAVGSNALGQSHRSTWTASVEARLDDYAAQITEHVLSRLVEYNYGPRAAPVRLEFAPQADEEANRMWSVVDKLLAGGAIPVDVPAVAARVGLPLLTEDEQPAVPAGEEPEETLRRVAPDLATELDALARVAPSRERITCRRDDDGAALAAAPADVSGLPEWKIPAAVDPQPWRRDLTPREQSIDLRGLERELNTAEARAIDQLVELLEASHDRVSRQVQGIMRKGGTVADVVTALSTVNVGPVAPWSAAWVELQRDVWGAGLASVSRELSQFADLIPGDIGRDGLALVRAYAQASADRTLGDLASRVHLELLAAFRSGVSTAGMVAAVGEVYDRVTRGEGQGPRLTTRMLSAKAMNEGRADAIMRGGIDLRGAQFSAILDTRTCGLCDRLDEQTIAIGDLDYAKFTPPLHHNCRCVWVYITADEADFVPTWSAPPKSLVDTFGGMVFGS